MKKLRVAILGQGRSGFGIHGKFFLSEANELVEVVAVVDKDEFRRTKAKGLWSCDVYADYTELFGRTDIDLVVNASYSHMHAPITKDLLLHGFNVLVEKPFGRTWEETQELIRIAESRSLVLGVFHQSLFAPNYLKFKEVVRSGLIGRVHQVNLRYNGFARRWDWQTLQCFCAGGLYNTGPHPLGIALDLLEWDPAVSVAFAHMDTVLTSGDGNDYAKVILTAPGRHVTDIEVDSADATSSYVFKALGDRGAITISGNHYTVRYIKPEELEARPVIRESLKNEAGEPVYCSEKLNWYTDEGTVQGDAFDSAVKAFYQMMYDRIFNGTPLTITPQMASEVIRIEETCHALCPLPVRHTLED